LTAGTRHRRTQTASLSVHKPFEIVVNSPQSETFPFSSSLSSLSPPTNSTPFSPTSVDYQLLRPHHALSANIRRSKEVQHSFERAPKIGLAVLLVGFVLFLGLQVVTGGTEAFDEERRIVELQKEAETNLLRRRIASSLFPNVTFWPSPSSSSSSSSSQVARNRPPTLGYLFPVRITEQESKAQQHLHQLSLLAISLNRTLILPNVGGSRLHSCQPLPFAFHYDLEEWARRFEGKLSIIAQEDWLQGVERNGQQYESRLIVMTEGKKVYAQQRKWNLAGTIGFDFDDFCLSQYQDLFDTTSNPPSTLYSPPHYQDFDNLQLAGFSNGLVSSLIRFSPPSSLSPSIPTYTNVIPYSAPSIPLDVLFIDYHLRYPLFPTFLPNSTDLTPPVLDLTGDTSTEINTTGTLDPELEGDEILEPLEVPIARFEPFPALQRLALVKSDNENDERRPHFLHFSPMPYSSIWNDVATSVAKHLSPYAATHWRMETVPSHLLYSCATSLATLLESLSSEVDPPHSIYLASDYSLDSVLSSDSSGLASALSDTFTDLTSSHRAAAARLVHLLRHDPSFFFPSFLRFSSSSKARQEPFPFHTLTSILSSAPSLLPSNLLKALSPLDHDLFALDSGLKGILDKLILTKAQHFVAGWGEKGPEMCSKLSSFTESVLSERKRLRGNTEDVREESRNPTAEAEETEEMDVDIVRWFKGPG